MCIALPECTHAAECTSGQSVVGDAHMRSRGTLDNISSAHARSYWRSSADSGCNYFVPAGSWLAALICSQKEGAWGEMQERYTTLCQCLHRYQFLRLEGSASISLPHAGNVHHAQETAGSWPGVTVILPVKGCKRHSISNWRSHVNLKYSGSVEFLFVVDSQADPSYGSLSALAATMRSRGSRVRVIVASQAQACSQKIANLGAGIKEALSEHEWVLCLDDDVLVHERFLEDLVRDMQQNPAASMATGYPFDIPEKDAGIFTYSCLAYHLPLSVAFAVRQRTMFVWGGCMLLRLHDLRNDRHGILAAWSQGGYSDDLTVASKFAEHKLQILCPNYAMLPQWLEPCSAGQFWNYLRRQLYVMDTYCNAHNRALNHTMLALHSYLSWSFILPLVLTLAEVVIAVLRLMTPARSQASASEGATASISGPALLYLAAFAFAQMCLRLLTGVTYTKLGGCIISVKHPEKLKESSHTS
ncbi:hypothetical protein CVIRNUC_001675 [Coccomyxa viridis]|uniref:ceramide glucosyltransferase n=1 Tax=Coccomyxa viridis TaxID=1274662 RepID=A0AAV1HX97_9CHLO|nr:hypothetical protein CVIRNUC_001675 [Coccomyxa viridis]